MDVLEICNEPNLLWSQTGLVGKVGDMMKTARFISGAYGNTPVMGAPSTHDTAGNSAVYLDYATFTGDLLDYLAVNGYYSVRDASGALNPHSVVWTMHNYNDVQRDHGPSTAAPDRNTYHVGDLDFDRTVIRTRRAAQYLNARGWAGWPNGTVGVPHIFVTEGGADIHDVMTIWGGVESIWPGPGHVPTEAAAKNFAGTYLLTRSYQRMATLDQGYGVDMVAQYLFYSDHRFRDGKWVFGDSGLLDDPVNESTNARYYMYTAYKSVIPGRL